GVSPGRRRSGSRARSRSRSAPRRPDVEAATEALLSCPACGTRLGPSFLACPTCNRLVHAERLKQLGREAEDATARGALPEALAAWRTARALLPAGPRQPPPGRAEIQPPPRAGAAGP